MAAGNRYVPKFLENNPIAEAIYVGEVGEQMNKEVKYRRVFKLIEQYRESAREKRLLESVGVETVEQLYLAARL